MSVRQPYLQTCAFTLADFVAPLSVEAFASDYWTRQPFMGQMPNPAGTELRQLAGEDVRDLLKQTRATRCMLWFETPQGPRECRVPIEDAFAFYEAGATLFFNLDTEWAAALGARLHQELGMVPPAKGQRGSLPSIFASRAGHGSKLHFDRFEIFSLQLEGRKDWWIAPPALDSVDENFAVGDAQWPRFDAYRIDAVAPPDKAAMHRMTLEPGAMLYLPRGHWHQTLADADTDSIALSFAFGPPMLREVLLPLIDHIATRDKRWRDWFGLRPEDEQRQACREVLADLAGELLQLTDNLHVPAEGTHVVRNPLITLGLTGEREGAHVAATLRSRGANSVEKDVLLHGSVVERLHGYWRAPDAAPRPVSALDDADRHLLALGYLRPCRPEH